MNHLVYGLDLTQSHVTVVVGFRKWKDVIMSSVLPDLLDAEENGVGCVEQSMKRSGELGIPLINLIVLITLEWRAFRIYCILFLCCRNSCSQRWMIIYSDHGLMLHLIRVFPSNRSNRKLMWTNLTGTSDLQRSEPAFIQSYEQRITRNV